MRQSWDPPSLVSEERARAKRKRTTQKRFAAAEEPSHDLDGAFVAMIRDVVRAEIRAELAAQLAPLKAMAKTITERAATCRCQVDIQ